MAKYLINTFYEKRIILNQILKLWLLLILVGCTTLYRPAAEEKEYFATADRNITPSQVRKNVDEYFNTKMAFAGVVTDLKSRRTEAGNWVFVIEIDHHDFDWLWDSGGIDFKHYYLSPNGDGPMRVSFAIKRTPSEGFLKQIEEEFKKGNMVVFYVKPTGVKNDVIEFDGFYVRGYSPSQFSISNLYYPNIMKQ